MKENDQKITREFCKGKVLIFYPETEKEAELIQRELFKMGFKWNNGAKKIQLDPLYFAKGICLDNGTLYPAPSERDKENGLLCTCSQFIKMEKNDQRITKEFCDGKTLLFYPETEEDAALIQREIFKLGFTWLDGAKKVQIVPECVAEGMVLDDGKLRYGASVYSERDGGILCTAAEFDEGYMSKLQIDKFLAETDALLERIDKGRRTAEEELERARTTNRAVAKGTGLTGKFDKTKEDAPTADPIPSSTTVKNEPKRGI